MTVANALNSTNNPSGKTLALLENANLFEAALGAQPVLLTSSGGSAATDGALSNHFLLSLTENTVLANPTNLVPGAIYTWQFIQTSPAKTLGFGNVFKWPGGTPLTVSTVNAATDIIMGYYNGSFINAMVLGQDFS
jgi:hypothetical protein